jgi:nitrate/nitrite transporter NarK
MLPPRFYERLHGNTGGHAWQYLVATGAAAGIALINLLGNLAGFASPYAVGWLKDATGSTDAGVYLLAAAMVVGAALTLSVPKRLANS